MKNGDEKPTPIGPETLIAEAEMRISWEALKAFYRKKGIKCLDCPAALIETFAEGAKLHGFDLDATILELNELEAESPFDGYPPTLMQRFLHRVFRKKIR